MADISKIKLPSGDVYDVKDAVARAALAAGMHFIGITTTALTDGTAAATITVNGQSHTSAAGDIVLYGTKEFVYSDSDGKWHEFGDNSAMRALAYKDNATGNYTPAGNVSAPSISVETAGTTTTVNSITDVGTLPELTTSVDNETLTIAFDSGTLPTKGANTTVKTGDAAYQASAPSFTGTQGTITVS